MTAQTGLAMPHPDESPESSVNSPMHAIAVELARTCGPFDADHARALLKILRRNKRDNRWQNFTPAEHDCLLDLVAQGAIGDERDAIYPTASVREALRLGYDRAGRDFPADSRFLPSRREGPPLTRR